MCEHQIPLRQLRIDTSRSFIREGWQCDIPRVSDPTAWSVTQTSMFAERGPSSSSLRESRRVKENQVAVTRKHFPEKTQLGKECRTETREWRRAGRRGMKCRSTDASRYSSWLTVFLKNFYPARKCRENHSWKRWKQLKYRLQK